MTEVVVTAVSVPQEAPEQPAPASDQLTPFPCVSFCRVAVKGAVVETCREAEPGLTVTEMGGGGGASVTVMVAEADLVLSATEVALRVTVAGEGAVAGAL